MVFLNDFIDHIPLITKSYIIISSILALLCTCEIISPFFLYLNWNLIIYNYQYWRLITCFFYSGQLGLPFFWQIYILIVYWSSLEEISFRRKSADFLYMLLICSILLLFISYFNRDLIIFSNLLTDIIIYMWGRRNSNTHILIFFTVIRAPYLSFALAFISILFGNNIYNYIISILVGHIYYFFVDIYPYMPTSNHLEIFKTPKILKKIFNQEDDN
eukprot:GHVL01007966.1.p1 GENE.GHVL01007966.1~~GHVL01007966.1.p1  ORF type:complete len:235 (+),score=59.05 GHVL01007966.1:58-705(+)